ncbi:MAG: YceI family protein [Gemmatimonadetes bacterium]|nr:YceI family protein [Gemmatimonadota bacterium]
MSASAAPLATTWKLDPSHSTVEFSAKHMMFTTVKGRFTEVEGTITAPNATLDGASVVATMKTASIDTRTEQRDQHLRSADFLDAENFPDVTFKSTKLAGTKEKFSMTGDLTIRGTTRAVTLDVTYEGTGIDPWGNERMGFSASGKIDRREFGLVWNQALEAGGVLVSNDVKIQIDAQVIRG